MLGFVIVAACLGFIEQHLATAAAALSSTSRFIFSVRGIQDKIYLERCFKKRGRTGGKKKGGEAEECCYSEAALYFLRRWIRN